MILVDYSGITMPIIFASKGDINEELIRHHILNGIRYFNVVYREKYGELVVAVDSSSWRKKAFPEYKANRKTSRDKSDLDWGFIYETIGKITDEIEENLPFRVVKYNDAEADDVIATLAKSTQNFGAHEDVMIVSADKDFIQLQKYDNVKQYSPMTKKLIVDKNPGKYIFEHVLRGDSSDGVPNVLSEDKCFVDGIRQTSLRKKLIEEWYEESKTKELSEVLDEKTYRNYMRNKSMIDLDCIPDEIANGIMETYENCDKVGNNKVLNYLITKRCNQLINCVDDFFTK